MIRSSATRSLSAAAIPMSAVNSARRMADCQYLCCPTNNEKPQLLNDLTFMSSKLSNILITFFLQRTELLLCSPAAVKLWLLSNKADAEASSTLRLRTCASLGSDMSLLHTAEPTVPPIGSALRSFRLQEWGVCHLEPHPVCRK